MTAAENSLVGGLLPQDSCCERVYAAFRSDVFLVGGQWLLSNVRARVKAAGHVAFELARGCGVEIEETKRDAIPFGLRDDGPRLDGHEPAELEVDIDARADRERRADVRQRSALRWKLLPRARCTRIGRRPP